MRLCAISASLRNSMPPSEAVAMRLPSEAVAMRLPSEAVAMRRRVIAEALSECVYVTVSIHRHPNTLHYLPYTQNIPYT